MRILQQIQEFLDTRVGLQAGDRIAVAFSGGPDSCLLLWALTRIARERHFSVHAIHVDHGLDSDSLRRARSARRLSAQFEASWSLVRLEGLRSAASGASLEAVARDHRYRALEVERNRINAKFLATGHHRQDQAETVALRMAYGTGIEGLAGVQPVLGSLIRPLLDLDKQQIDAALRALAIEPVRDPANRDLRQFRNRIRHRVLPRLRHRDPQIDKLLSRLARAACRARVALEKRVQDEVPLCRTERGPVVDLAAFLALPSEMHPFVFSAMSRQAGRDYPPSAAAQLELQRQLENGRRVGCDCGDGWRWEVDRGGLGLFRTPTPTASFAYTVAAPGECRIRELALRFRIRQGAVAEWMFQPSSWRAGLVLPIAPGDSVVVRNRRDGDRIRPFGCTFHKRLKDVLIDRHIPRWRRGRLVLLEVASKLAWVAGVTIDDSCRVEPGQQAWIAELEPF